MVSVTVASYLGELFQAGRRPNALLRLAGGLQGAVKTANAREFPVGVFYDLRAPSQSAKKEGADAPTPEHRTMTQATNVIQIFHEAVETTYLAVSDQSFAGLQKLPGSDAVQDPRDHNWQVLQALATIAQDANFSFVQGTYNNPADPRTEELKTRGLATAIVTNVIDGSGVDSAAAYRDLANELHRELLDNSGMEIDDGHVLFVDSIQFNNFSLAFESKTQAPQDRRVAGVQVRTIFTRYGRLNLVYEPDMPAQTAVAANMSVVGVVGLPVPGKGILFEEPLAKQGSRDGTQIYGQLGLDHGPEWMHAKATGLSADPLVEATDAGNGDGGVVG